MLYDECFSGKIKGSCVEFEEVGDLSQSWMGISDLPTLKDQLALTGIFLDYLGVNVDISFFNFKNGNASLSKIPEISDPVPLILKRGSRFDYLSN